MRFRFSARILFETSWSNFLTSAGVLFLFLLLRVVLHSVERATFLCERLLEVRDENLGVLDHLAQAPDVGLHQVSQLAKPA